MEPLLIVNFYLYNMIFVTGGTGLVGSHLLFELVSNGVKVRALKRGSSTIYNVEKVFSFYSADPKTLFSQIEWVDGDVKDMDSLLQAMNNVEYVYHAAAMVSLDPIDADEIMKVNIEGTANVVNACLAKNIKKLCHVSSVAALGDVPQDKMIDETFFWKGAAKDNYYSISKYGAEREVWRGIEEGLNIVTVNPAIVVGPGNWNSSSCAIFKASYRRIPFYPNGSGGYVDVRDVARAMIKLMESEIKNERFLLNAGNKSYRDFADMVHDELGKKRPSIKAGKFLLGLGWRVEKIWSFFRGRPPVLTKTIAHAIDLRSSFSSEKIKKMLGYEFIPIEQSVKETAKLFLKDKFKNS